jgi:hypothetical protein
LSKFPKCSPNKFSKITIENNIGNNYAPNINLHTHKLYVGLYPKKKTSQHICVKVILVFPLEMPLYIEAYN